MYKRACVCVCAHTPVCVQLGVCVCRGGDFPVLLMRGTQLSLSVLLWADIPLAPTNTDDRGKMERRWKEQLDQSGDAESRKRRCTGRRSLGFHSSIFYANSNILNYKGWTDAAETWRKCYINIVKRVFFAQTWCENRFAVRGNVGAAVMETHLLNWKMEEERLEKCFPHNSQKFSLDWDLNDFC